MAYRSFYAYDFGDGWEHALIHEGMEIAKRSMRYRRCVSGAHGCPPEDCGGPHRYAELLKVIANRKHPRHKSMVEFVHGRPPESSGVGRRLGDILEHEVRHWAQLATVCRMNGHAVDGQDLLASPLWGGEFIAQ